MCFVIFELRLLSSCLFWLLIGKAILNTVIKGTEGWYRHRHNILPLNVLILVRRLINSYEVCRNIHAGIPNVKEWALKWKSLQTISSTSNARSYCIRDWGWLLENLCWFSMPGTSTHDIANIHSLRFSLTLSRFLRPGSCFEASVPQNPRLTRSIMIHHYQGAGAECQQNVWSHRVLGS